MINHSNLAAQSEEDLSRGKFTQLELISISSVITSEIRQLNPEASASITAIGNPSCNDGNRNASAAEIKADTSFLRPAKITRSLKPSLSTLSLIRDSKLPAPININFDSILIF